MLFRGLPRDTWALVLLYWSRAHDVLMLCVCCWLCGSGVGVSQCWFVGDCSAFDCVDTRHLNLWHPASPLVTLLRFCASCKHARCSGSVVSCCASTVHVGRTQPFDMCRVNSSCSRYSTWWLHTKVLGSTATHHASTLPAYQAVPYSRRSIWFVTLTQCYKAAAIVPTVRLMQQR